MRDGPIQNIRLISMQTVEAALQQVKQLPMKKNMAVFQPQAELVMYLMAGIQKQMAEQE